MPITTTDTRTKQVIRNEHVGRVLDIRYFKARRNMSDTLDYTDFQHVDCTEALVYRGRRGAPNIWSLEERDLEVHERFTWVDVSNHFAWRSDCHTVATVDLNLHDPANAKALEDFNAWTANNIAQESARQAAQQAREAQEKADAQKRERNRPVVGKPMKVVSGRKVPVGTVGTVAFVSGSGGVLLKDDARWQDRKADGVWVDPRHLEAR